MSDRNSPAGEIRVQERFRGLRLALWFCLVVLFVTFVVVGLFGGTMGLIALGAGRGTAVDVARLPSVLLSFKAAQIDAFLDGSPAASGALFFFGSALLATLIAFVQRSIERTHLKRLTITPLLPGVKRRFIPCEEGIYTLWFHNIYTGSVWYNLRPWSSLIVDTLDTQRRRIAVRDATSTVLLKAEPLPGDQADYYESLKQVVLSHLPPERQVPQPKRLRFKWGICLALIAAAVVVSSLGLRWLDGHTKGAAGDGHCDVCGVSLGWDYVQVSQAEKVVHEYCQLHGLAHAVVHPLSALRSAIAGIPAMARADGLPKALVGNSAAVYGVLIWWIYGCIALAVATRRPYVLDR